MNKNAPDYPERFCLKLDFLNDNRYSYTSTFTGGTMARWPQKKILYDTDERMRVLERAYNNVFYIPSEAVSLDLLTDSGTGRMSDAQWAALQDGDESYAGSRSARRLKQSIRELFGVPYVLLVHQGRAAENVFGNVMQQQGGMVILGNTPFDTTRLHIESRGGIIIDCTRDMIIPALSPKQKTWSPFGGNVDTRRLERELASAHFEGHRVAYVLVTATCNSKAGQPVSLGNIHTVSELAHSFNVPVFLDLARYAENAFFIKERESGFAGFSIADIVREMVACTDGFLASGKKDALGNIGGFIGLRSPALVQQLIGQIIMTEGLDLENLDAESHDDFGGYGGMTGRDMEALRQGILESTDEEYLRARTAQVQWLAESLRDIGIPVLPPGGHAVFVDAGAFLPHLEWGGFPGHALTLALYLEGGIRAVEVGSLMLGRHPVTGNNRQAPQELTRLAIPRRVYSNEELFHIVETFKVLRGKAKQIGPVRISDEMEPRHFRAAFSWDGIG